MGPWIYRRDSAFPYQWWNAFPPEAVVQVKNCYGESNIGPASSYWWGYERDNAEGVITKARRLDRPKGTI